MCKCLFLAGVNDTWRSRERQGAGGLLSEYDRERFQEQKVALAPGAEGAGLHSEILSVSASDKPSEYLYLTFSKISSEGENVCVLPI